MNDLLDRYVIANALGCAVALVVHVALLRTGLLFLVAFACFLATLATHPDARVSRVGPIVLGARIDFGAVWRTAPRWALAITGGFLAYIAWFFLSHRQEMTGQEPPRLFAALFAVVCAHLLWAGVGTRLGALRALRERAIR